MKYLIMCEGPNEREIINILLENDLLKFTEDDLLGLTPYHAGQIASSGQVKAELNIYPGEVACSASAMSFIELPPFCCLAIAFSPYSLASKGKKNQNFGEECQ